MNRIFFVSSILSFGILTSLAGIIYLRQPRERLNRSFALMCLAMAVAGFSEAMLRGASGLAAAKVWIQCATTAWPVSVTLLLIFCLVYTRKERILGSRALIAAVLFVPLALGVLNLSTPLLGATPVLLSSGYERRISERSILLPIAGLWGAFAGATAIALLIHYRHTARERMARRQTVFIVWGFLMPLLAGIVTQAALPRMGIGAPTITPLSRLWLALFVGYAMGRYDLFRLDPAKAADPMFSVMKEAVLLLDPGGIVIYSNRCADRLWQRTPRSLAGRPVTGVLGPGFAQKGGMDRLLGDDRETALEVPCVAADGAVLSLLVSGALLRNGPGDVVGAMLVASDISGLKRLEETLRENRRILRNLVDHGQAHILLLDPRGLILEANEPFARSLGRSVAELTGRNAFSLFPEAVARELGRKIAEAMASGIPARFQDRHDDRVWEHRCTPIADRTGRPAGMTVFSLDVTERVEAERARERLIREQSGALARVKTLTGLIPICAHCKRIRNDKGYWQQVEQYVAERTDADFSHGLCNDCLRVLYPEIADEVLSERRPDRG